VSCSAGRDAGTTAAIERLARIGHERAGALEHRERRMPLVEVAALCRPVSVRPSCTVAMMRTASAGEGQDVLIPAAARDNRQERDHDRDTVDGDPWHGETPSVNFS
jgi:hypothetical protein